MVFCPYGVALRPSVGRSFPFLLLALTNKKEEKEGKIKTPKEKGKKKQASKGEGLCYTRSLVVFLPTQPNRLAP